MASTGTGVLRVRLLTRLPPSLLAALALVAASADPGSASSPRLCLLLCVLAAVPGHPDRPGPGPGRRADGAVVSGRLSPPLPSEGSPPPPCGRSRARDGCRRSSDATVGRRWIRVSCSALLLGAWRCQSPPRGQGFVPDLVNCWSLCGAFANRPSVSNPSVRGVRPESDHVAPRGCWRPTPRHVKEARCAGRSSVVDPLCDVGGPGAR